LRMDRVKKAATQLFLQVDKIVWCEFRLFIIAVMRDN
jgi:hypothetical protein